MNPGETSARIIEAAIEVFLEKGYAAATIRDICARAQVNVAAVNYHFGSKEAMHAAALEWTMARCHERYPMQEGLEGDMAPEERLRRFVSNMLRLNFPEDPEMARRGRLFWMELSSPSPVFAPLVERFMRPIKDTLEAVIGDIIGPADAETLRLCAGSVAGQCLFHAQNRMVITQLYPDKTYHPHDVKRLAEHVFTFSLAGLHAVRDSLRRKS